MLSISEREMKDRIKFITCFMTQRFKYYRTKYYRGHLGNPTEQGVHNFPICQGDRRRATILHQPLALP